MPSARELARQGYRRTSRAFGMVSRVDREDWAEVLAERLGGPAERFRKAPEVWCDHYRRVYSKDTVTLSPRLALKVPCSNNDPTGYIPKLHCRGTQP